MCFCCHWREELTSIAWFVVLSCTWSTAYKFCCDLLFFHYWAGCYGIATVLLLFKEVGSLLEDLQRGGNSAIFPCKRSTTLIGTAVSCSYKWIYTIEVQGLLYILYCTIHGLFGTNPVPPIWGYRSPLAAQSKVGYRKRFAQVTGNGTRGVGTLDPFEGPCSRPSWTRVSMGTHSTKGNLYTYIHLLRNMWPGPVSF